MELTILSCELLVCLYILSSNIGSMLQIYSFEWMMHLTVRLSAKKKKKRETNGNYLLKVMF